MVNSINILAKKVNDDIKEKGIIGIINLFAKEDKLSKDLNVNKENEYLKRMLVAQMDLDRMLLTHKYFNSGFELIPKFRKEAEQIRTFTETSSVLKFDDDTINSLFGNSLEITSEEKYENWKEFAYGNIHNGKKLDDLYFEEEFKCSYEKEQNKIKKIIKSFKYKKLFKQDLLSDSYTRKVQEVLRKNIMDNPNNTFIAHQACHNMLEKGIAEYESNEELKNIAKATLKSLEIPQDSIINIENTCKEFRNEMQDDNSPRMGINYRKKQVTIGSNEGIRKSKEPIFQTIAFEEIPNAIENLQQEYEELYINSESKEDYIRGVSKIYADYIYIQPYEDGNKRTATCLLNSMLLSKGIVPPPISLVNNEQIIEAINKAKNKDYTMLQNTIVSKQEEMKNSYKENNKIELPIKDQLKESKDNFER